MELTILFLSVTKSMIVTAEEELITYQAGDAGHDMALSACKAHCDHQDQEKSFFGLRKKQLFTYSCICLTHSPVDSGKTSRILRIKKCI